MATIYAEQKYRVKLYKLNTVRRVLTTDISSTTIIEDIPEDKIKDLIFAMQKYATPLSFENYEQKLELLKR